MLIGLLNRITVKIKEETKKRKVGTICFQHITEEIIHHIAELIRENKKIR